MTATHPKDFSRCVFYKEQPCSCGATFEAYQARKNPRITLPELDRLARKLFP